MSSVQEAFTNFFPQALAIASTASVNTAASKRGREKLVNLLGLTFSLLQHQILHTSIHLTGDRPSLGFLKDNHLREAGPVFFKHNLVAMPDLEMEFGVPVDRTIAVDGEFVSGVLPAGRYAEVTYLGPYDNLIAVNGMLIDWARNAGWTFDAREEVGGTWFANRLEIYHNSPAEQPDPNQLQTTVSIKLKD